jgi:hypothetical protein
MKKLLLTSIAVLFLATGTANAGRYNNWKCGAAITLQTSEEKINPPDARPILYGFYIDGLRVPKAQVTLDRDGQPRVNGKRCTWSEEQPR